MLEMLKSKIILGLAGFGFALSLILGLVSRSDFLSLVVHCLLSALVLGLAGFGLDFFLRQTLSPEDYESLLSPGSGNQREEGQANQPRSYQNLDILEDSSENNYSNIMNEESAEKPVKKEKPVPEPAFDDVPADQGQEGKTSSSFQEESFEEAPRIKPMENVEMQDELERLSEVGKEEKDRKQAMMKDHFQGHEGTVSFKVKNKKITAEPQIIAKAIQTILHKE